VKEQIPSIHLLDAFVDVLCILFLPFMAGRQKPVSELSPRGTESIIEITAR